MQKKIKNYLFQHATLNLYFRYKSNANNKENIVSCEDVSKLEIYDLFLIDRMFVGIDYVYNNIKEQHPNEYTADKIYFECFGTKEKMFLEYIICKFVKPCNKKVKQLLELFDLENKKVRTEKIEDFTSIEEKMKQIILSKIKIFKRKEKRYN